MEELSGFTKSKRTAFLLALCLGGLGAHRFYLGHVGSGFTLLILGLLSVCTYGLTIPFVALWVLIDLAALSFGALSDADGYPLV